MLKASALYIVIVIALVIAVLCSALIAAAYFYQSNYQAKFRNDRLHNNLQSGINLLLTSKDSAYRQKQTISLFAGDADSISLQRYPWGVLDIGIAQAFLQRDTLSRVFSLAHTIDSAKWSSLYLIDEDRPLSLSGKTAIRGDVYIPKAGVKTAYVDNQSYTGDKKLVIGRIHDSERKLPILSETRLQQLRWFASPSSSLDTIPLTGKGTERSFKLRTWIINLGRQVTTLQNISLRGNLVIHSDTTLIIDSTAALNNVIIMARSISVKSGFHGNGQFFATDSIGVEKDCHLEYPSCLGVLRHNTPIVGYPEKISIGENSTCQGLIFTYEKADNPLRPVIFIGKNAVMSGQVYSQGIVSFKTGAIIRGSVMTSRFLYQSEFTAYENYLIGATIDGPALSAYYLTTDLTPVSGKQKKIMQWLETK